MVLSDLATDASHSSPVKKRCRKCGTDFDPAPSQLRKCDFICRPCRRSYQRERQAAAKANGTFDYEKARRWCREWRERNLEAQRERERNYHAKDRERSRAKALARQKANLPRIRQYVMEREKHVRRAIPKWADRAAIRTIYESCPPGHHVDHIIPLKGRNVCGLHVENNLQHLPAVDNIKKGNNFDGW